MNIRASDSEADVRCYCACEKSAKCRKRGGGERRAGNCRKRDKIRIVTELWLACIERIDSTYSIALREEGKKVVMYSYVVADCVRERGGFWQISGKSVRRTTTNVS